MNLVQLPSGSVLRKPLDTTKSATPKKENRKPSEPPSTHPSLEVRKDGLPMIKMRRTGHLPAHLTGASSKSSSHAPAHRQTLNDGASAKKKQDQKPSMAMSGPYQQVIDYALQQSTKMSTAEQASFLTGVRYAFDTGSRMSTLVTAGQDLSVVQGRVLDLLRVFLASSSSTAGGNATQPANTPLLPWELAPGSSRATEPDADGNRGQVFFSHPLIERDQVSLTSAYQIGRHKKIESKLVHSGHSLTVEAEQEWERDCIVTAGCVKVSVQGAQQQLGHQSTFLVNRGVDCRIENAHREVAMITIIWREVDGYR